MCVYLATFYMQLGTTSEAIGRSISKYGQKRSVSVYLLNHGNAINYTTVCVKLRGGAEERRPHDELRPSRTVLQLCGIASS